MDLITHPYIHMSFKDVDAVACELQISLFLLQHCFFILDCKLVVPDCVVLSFPVLRV